MSDAHLNQPVEFLTLPEVGRRLNVSSMTVRRWLVREQIAPDGVVIEGRQLRTPIIKTERVETLRLLLEANL